ncbi:endonuclease/exonuclease/phosphatase family protein [Mycolicibacterium mucogenicum]|jgi:endonuclease/exonuclease/phosphatase (EEP) superfamily protein YafD|uniref:Endonuclease/exonuclease/phosphatase family protein n=1 Tax=Mycolicibacterium mucogenicum TaxID=56689 RepID=A0A4R5WPZ4_MYCMU|nr:endonuclease/exonuclease/phosphatase family protein [Mycolicibacterium mucogenicum]TDK93687.1 endonuclease/exonuclease/phosphatase family protein [Mycolicibacterium mucogenicum]TXH24598.1 MAG: endonuclease/exonuclease/phosphatase family protein [Mycobacterium sp.]
MWQSVLTYAGAFSLCTAAAALAMRWIPVVNRSLLALAASAPYLSIGAPIGAVLSGVARNWPLTAIAVAITVAAAVVQLPLFRRAKAPSGTALRFLSANLRYGRADAEAVVRYAEASADIVALQELTPAALARLEAVGLDRTFPHRALREMDEPGGVGLWSRYPISDVRIDDGFWLGMLAADVHVPEAPAPARVLTVHLSAPWPDPLQGWRDDLARLAGTLLKAARASTGPVLLAGDLNATPDMREFRRLLRQGYQDAGAQAGAGVVRTHPSDIAAPPVFAVDHILTRGYVATSLRTLPVPGSDHRALLAELVAG